MAASNFMLKTSIISLFFFCTVCFLPKIKSQDTRNPSSAPTVSDCSPALLPLLAPCGSFVQGAMPSPADSCCDNLRTLNSQQLSCLCLMLSDTSLISFPFNRTLAFELPSLCSIPGGIPNCSGLPPTTPTSQVSFGTRRNATVVDPPTVTVNPRFHNSMGERPLNSGAKLNAINHMFVGLLAEVIFVVGTAYTF